MVVPPKQAAVPLPIFFNDEAQQICRAGVDRQIEALDPVKRARVSDACVAAGLSAEGTWGVLATTCDLSAFEHDGRHLVMTTAQRFEAVAEIRDLAGALADALAALPVEEEIDVHRAFREAHSQLPEAESLMFDNASLPSVEAIMVLSKSAQAVLDARPDSEGKGGRRKLLDAYTRYVSRMAYEFENAGLPVGRGGPFEKLCTVVFEVAGVRAAPEGAIRNLSKWRKR